MPQRTALSLALGLTAFVLVLLGGAAVYLNQTSRMAAAQAATAQNTANTRPAASAVGSAAQETVAGSPPAPVSVTPRYAVSTDQARRIALAVAAGSALNGEPELVIFRGVAAYEVTLDRGVVYVDAATGAVLYNAVASVQAISATQSAAPALAANSPSNSGESGNRYGTHRGEQDDDDHDDQDDDHDDQDDDHDNQDDDHDNQDDD